MKKLSPSTTTKLEPPKNILPLHSKKQKNKTPIIVTTPVPQQQYRLPEVAEQWRQFWDKNINTIVLVVALKFASHLHVDGLHFLSVTALLIAGSIVFFLGTKIKSKIHENINTIEIVKPWFFALKVLGYIETVVTVFIVNIMSSYIQSRINDEVENFATVSIPIMMVLAVVALSMFIEYRLTKTLYSHPSDNSHFFDLHK